MKHKFSIVIPCFNAQETIVKCIESCTSQTFEDFDIIIVDDFSQDFSCDIIDDFIKRSTLKQTVKLIKLSENQGPSNARNVGIDASNSEYIALLDADDYFYKNKLSLISDILNDEPSIDLIGHDYSVNEYSLYENSYKISSVSLFGLLIKNFAVTPSIVFKRSLNTRFDKSFRFTEDHDFYLRVILDGYVIKYLNRPLVRLNRSLMSEGGLSSNKFKMRKGEFKMYFKFCTREVKYVPLLPVLFSFCLLKHLIKMAKHNH